MKKMVGILMERISEMNIMWRTRREGRGGEVMQGYHGKEERIC